MTNNGVIKKMMNTTKTKMRSHIIIIALLILAVLTKSSVYDKW